MPHLPSPNGKQALPLYSIVCFPLFKFWLIPRYDKHTKLDRMASESCGFIGETFCLQEEGVGWLWSPEWPPQNSARSTVIWHHGEWWPCLKYRGKERILKYTKVHTYIRFTPLFTFALPVWFDLFPFFFLRSVFPHVQVPFGPLAFMPGKLVHTNEVTVLLGDNWFAKCSAKQAQKIVDHRMKCEYFP